MNHPLPTPVFIAAAAWARRSECDHLLRDPDFRKATTPMMMAWKSVEKVLAQIGRPYEKGQPLNAESWGLIFGTSHGELEVTKEFLATYAAKGLARPILFQNSLHHSPLGFISLRLGIEGPGVTVSNHFFSGDDAVATAMELIRAGDCDIAVTVAVDALVEGITNALGQYYPRGIISDEGAGCLILANGAGLKKLGAPAIAALQGIENVDVAPLSSPQRLAFTSDYDADAVEKIARVVSEYHGQQAIVLNKPDGQTSLITFAKHGAGKTL